jgi:putative colanic acid biosynthesis acetyltransferase WcaF
MMSCLVKPAVDQKVDLSLYTNRWYSPGPLWKRVAWFIVNAIVFRNPISCSSTVKRVILRAFGAQVGRGVVIKPSVNIKYPWFLTIGDHSWVGEGCWIDNLGTVKIGKSACLSQRSMLLCGNHNYKKRSFDLIIGDVVIGDGAWVGAGCVVTAGVTVGDHAVLAVGSVASSNLSPMSVYRGNPAVFIRARQLSE